jgi:tetratricopeptide (TPR) repeat protein
MFNIRAMLKKILLLGSFGSFSAMAVFGQCPNRDSLEKRLILLRNSQIAPSEQLKELLVYDSLIKRCPYRSDSIHALLVQRIGVMFFKQGDYAKALRYTQQSVSINSPGSGVPATSTKDLIRSYYNLSAIYAELNRPTERINAIDSCVAIALRTRSVDVYSLFSLKQKVEYLFDVGDYQRAFTSAEMGELLTKQYMHGPDSIDYVINLLTHKVNALLDFKDYDFAERIITDKITDCQLIGAKQYLGNLYEQLGRVLARRKSYDRAEFYFKKALQCHKDDHYDLGCEQTLTNLGFYVFIAQHKNYEKAIKTYKTALRYIENSKTPNDEYAIQSLNIFANIANAFVQQKRYDSANNYYQKALNQIKPGINEHDLLRTSLGIFVALKKVDLIISLLIDKGDAHLKQFRETNDPKLADSAILIYKVADQLINKIKSEQSEVLSKLFWRSNSHRLYEHAIDACYLTNNLSDAFFFFEKSRAVLLNDQLNEQRWMGEKDILMNTQVRKKIAQLEREFNNMNPSDIKYADVQNELFDRKMELDRLNNMIKARNPLYYQSFLDSTTTTPAEVQKKLLGDHQALVEFFSGDSSIYCYLITLQTVHLTRIDKFMFDSLVQSLNSFVSNRDLLNRNFGGFVSVSRGLYRLVFQNNPVPSGRIIISPDGYYFPFEALVTSNSATIDYFVYDHAVSYTYSARYLLNQFAANSEVSFRNFLGIAPIHYLPSTHLTPLLGSDHSLRQLESRFSHSDCFLSANASKNNFLQQFSKYKIVQLYTHAVSNSAAGEPAIYLADSVLYLSDLVNQQKPVTSLVMLSACETAKGKFYEGEGVFSFSRGFAALGIPASVTNLWSVENESTYQLTELFYKYVAKDLPPDVALQEAKKEFITVESGEKKLPYFWAAAILAGKTDRIELKKSFPWSLALIGAGIVTLFVCAWHRAMKTKRTARAHRFKVEVSASS